MLASTLESALLGGLRQLRQEIEQYPDERDLWRAAPGIRNCGGTLALHQVYSIRYLVGAVLGGIPREWRREEAFARRDVPRAELLREIDEAVEVVRRTFERLDDARLAEEYPEEVSAPRPFSSGAFLVHLAVHTGYHNGQVNYHRRLLSGAGN